MIDRQTYQCLQSIIRREGRSFLQYAGESFPWNTPQNGATVERVQELVLEERDGVAALSRFVAKNHLAPPYLGAYPSYFTSYNYMSLDRLVPLLIDHQRRGIQELEADLRAIHDQEAKKHVESTLAVKRRHLQALEALAPGSQG